MVIKNKAQEYATSVIDGFGVNGVPCGIKDIHQMIANGYVAGATDTLADQWHDAEDYPPIDEDVLVDYPYEHGFVVAYYDGEDWYITETGRLIRPTRWMPIPPDNKTESSHV